MLWFMSPLIHPSTHNRIGRDLYIPGAGELITGPTVLGEVMAAGNLICASPPYLLKQQ